MAKVKLPLQSLEAWGTWANSIIFRRGGVATKYFKPRNPATAAQQAQREAFREWAMAGLTKEQADLLYAAIEHLHADLYAAIEHEHEHSALTGLGDDDHTQYLTEGRGDARYSGLAHEHSGMPFLLPFATASVQYPATATGGLARVSIDRALTLLAWAMSWRVATLNNSSNYWTIILRRLSDSATLAGFDTIGGTAGNWYLEEVSSFDVAEPGADALGITVYATKTGSPGDLSWYGPLVTVFE